MYKYILFDLDGTLTDSSPGITNSVAYALDKFGIAEYDRNDLRKFIGPPLVNSFMEFYGFDEDKALLGVEYYREYFRDRGIFENSVYEGVIPVLNMLKDDGKILVLATSKPEEFALQILEHFGLAEYFDYVVGASMDGSLCKKSEIIRVAFERAGIDKDKLAETVMVGDRKHDIEGAAINGIDSIGVLYGFGSLEELTDAGATYIADSPVAILGIVG